MISKINNWVIDRFALRPIYDHFLNRRVPRAPWYSGDGSTLMALLGIQVLTGATMALAYSPAADSAYSSVVYITEHLALGWFIRGLHYWSAGAMMVMVAFHLLRQLLLGGYKSPREGTWLLGVLLFFGILMLAYTGYLLRWDERSIYGVRVMLHMLDRVPLIGHFLVLFAQGGPDIGPSTLTRLYAVHVLIIPLLMFVLVAYHVYLVVVRGTITQGERSVPIHSVEQQRSIYYAEADSSDRGETFFPFTMLKAATMVTVVVSIVVGLTIVVGPQKLYPEANLTEPSIPAEEWWFWWFSGFIALMPRAFAPWIVVLLPVVVFVSLVALPFIDRSPLRGVRNRPMWMIAVLIIVVALLALSDYRRRSHFTGWPDLSPPAVPVGMELPPDAEQGRVLFATYGCNSCHSIGGNGRKVAVDFASLRGQLSLDKIREYVLNPPAGVAMPSYRGRMTEEELEAVVAFCHVVQTFPLQD